MRVRRLAGFVGHTLAICVGVLSFAAAGRDLASPTAVLPDNHCPGN